MNIRNALKNLIEPYSLEYEECRKDLRFSSLIQYEKYNNKEIQLVFDRINRIKNRIVNPCRINPFGFGIDNNSFIDPLKAARINALFDMIQRDTNAYSVYTDALDIALMCGRSYIIIGNDYESNMSINQKILITCPQDPTTVYIDASSTSVDGSDIDNAAQITYISKEYAKRVFDIEEEELNISILPDDFNNKSENKVEHIAYWYKKSEKINVCFVKNNEKTLVIPTEKVKEMLEKGILDSNFIIGERNILDEKVKYERWCCGKLIYDSELPIRYIPVVPVYGKRVYLQDRITYKGLPYFLRDVQRVINFAANAEAYRLNSTPSVPFIAEFEQVMDGGPIQRMWENVNRERRGVLVYRRVDGVNPPYRPDISTQTQDIQVTRKGLQNDADEILGFSSGDFGNNLGRKDVSGIALSIMQENADYQTAGWTQNLRDSIIQVGRIISELAPYVYSEGMFVTYYGPNGKKYNEIVSFDDFSGNMKITITTTPEGEQKRRYGAQLLTTLAGQNQEFANAFVDVILKNSGADIPEEVIERARKLVPGYLNGTEPDPEAIKTIEQMQISMEEMQKTLEQYEAIISQLQAKIIGDTRKSEIEYIKEQLKIIGDLLLEQQKQKGKIDEIKAKAVVNTLSDSIEENIKDDIKFQPEFKVEYRDPLERFTPLVKGPLVVGDKNGISPLAERGDL